MQGDSHLKKSTHLEASAGKSTPHRHSRITKKKQKQRQNFQQQQEQEWQDNLAEVTPVRSRQLKVSLHNQQNQMGRSLTEAKKKDKDIKMHDHLSNIFKLPSSSGINPKFLKQDIRLPTLDYKNRLDEDLLNPERKKVIKIPIDRLKPLPADEVKRRFMLKYHL